MVSVPNYALCIYQLRVVIHNQRVKQTENHHGISLHIKFSLLQVKENFIEQKSSA